MRRYTVSVKCPHCARFTYLDDMDTGKFRWAEKLLMPVLKGFNCGHCAKRFGDEGALVRTLIAN